MGLDNMQTEDEGSISGNDDNNKGDTIVVQPLLLEPTCRCTILTTKAVELSSYHEVLEGSERDYWQKAINEEYTSLQKNNTWVLTQLPLGHKAITCKWVFWLKINVNGTKRYKARLVI